MHAGRRLASRPSAGAPQAPGRDRVLATVAFTELLATFDGPARAIRCVRSIERDVATLGLHVRAGPHTGEIELLGGDVGGIAVAIAARLTSLAGSDEVVVSSTVKDLVAGSGIRFEDRGVHALKGVPEDWHIFAVQPT